MPCCEHDGVQEKVDPLNDAPDGVLVRVIEVASLSGSEADTLNVLAEFSAPV